MIETRQDGIGSPKVSNMILFSFGLLKIALVLRNYYIVLAHLICKHFLYITVSLLRLKSPCKDMEEGLSTMRLIVVPVMVLSRYA